MFAFTAAFVAARRLAWFSIPVRVTPLEKNISDFFSEIRDSDCAIVWIAYSLRSVFTALNSVSSGVKSADVSAVPFVVPPALPF
jgi:hypothetical protein